MAHSIEEALTLAERIGYPVIVRPRFVIGGLAIDFCYSPDGPGPAAGRGDGRRSRPAGADRSLPRGRRGRRRRRSATATRGADPGPARARRAGRRPLRRLGRRCSRRRPSAEVDQGLIVATMERVVLALGARGLVNAQFIVREDGVYLIEVNPRAVADGAVPVQGHGRADGRAGGPDRARRHARGARLAGRPARAARRSSRSRRRPSRRPSCKRRRSVRRAVHAVDRRGDRDPRGSAGRAGEGARWGVAAPAAARLARTSRARSRCCRSPTATSHCCRGWPPALATRGLRDGRDGRDARDAGGPRATRPARGKARRVGRNRRRPESWT